MGKCTTNIDFHRGLWINIAHSVLRNVILNFRSIYLPSSTLLKLVAESDNTKKSLVRAFGVLVDEFLFSAALVIFCAPLEVNSSTPCYALCLTPPCFAKQQKQKQLLFHKVEFLRQESNSTDIGYISCAQEIWQTEGILGFYKV